MHVVQMNGNTNNDLKAISEATVSASYSSEMVRSGGGVWGADCASLAIDFCISAWAFHW